MFSLILDIVLVVLLFVYFSLVRSGMRELHQRIKKLEGENKNGNV